MAFLKRLGFYLVGLSIGIVFLTLFLKKKSEETGTEFCYFPNCRTLKDIRSKPLTYSQEIEQLIKNEELDSVDIRTMLTIGEVDFSTSDTHSKPCKTYFIKGTANNKNAVIKILNCEQKAILESVTY